MGDPFFDVRAAGHLGGVLQRADDDDNEPADQHPRGPCTNDRSPPAAPSPYESERANPLPHPLPSDDAPITPDSRVAASPRRPGREGDVHAGPQHPRLDPAAATPPDPRGAGAAGARRARRKDRYRMSRCCPALVLHLLRTPPEVPAMAMDRGRPPSMGCRGQ